MIASVASIAGTGWQLVYLHVETGKILVAATLNNVNTSRDEQGMLSVSAELQPTATKVTENECSLKRGVVSGERKQLHWEGRIEGPCTVLARVYHLTAIAHALQAVIE